MLIQCIDCRRPAIFYVRSSNAARLQLRPGAARILRQAVRTRQNARIRRGSVSPLIYTCIGLNGVLLVAASWLATNPPFQIPRRICRTLLQESLALPRASHALRVNAPG